MAGAAASFPAAAGVRAPWSAVPEPVRAAIEQLLGSNVVAAESQAGGFSPGVAARVTLANGRRAFVKAAGAAPNPVTPSIHRREAEIAAALPPRAPVPRLRGTYDDGDWVALVFDEIDGRPPRLPWERAELERVLIALHAMADALTPSPIAARPAAETLAEILCGWRALAAADELRARVPAAARERLDTLVALEVQWPAAIAGDSLAHLDLRADNLLLTETDVFVVDWPWAALAAPWVDLVLMLPSVEMQGGPLPDDVWGAHPLARGVDDDRVDAAIAAVAGFFVWQSLLPAPPGLPTLRAFQAGQAAPAFAWLARRRGWVPAER
jgi:aminoglycoside phosphotransferase (APT) family kinase protein